jgi:predicted dehydrogenase
MTMLRHSRRTFLKRAAAASAAFSTFTIAGTKASGRVLGANEAIRVGVAGINGRGGSHIGMVNGSKDCQLTYLIDPDSRLFARRLGSLQGRKPKCVQDVREALDDQNLDAITIATPNHWHALMTIWACQAGKDVYVEKPCSHNVREGRVAVEAARKYGRIVQHGTQKRGGNEGDLIQALARSGQLGKLLVSRGLCYKGRGSIGFKEPTPPPAELDFNLWLGPAPDQPYHGNLVHYNWHWFWDTGNGDIGNQGVHEMDRARWAIAGATLPTSVISIGGRFGYKDQGETANTQIAIMDYGPTQLIFEVRGLKTNDLYGQRVGTTFHFEAGVVAGGKFYPNGSDKPTSLPQVEIQRPARPGGGIFGNFVAAIRSRDHNDLLADIEEGHYSSALCHLANISYRLGEEVSFDTKSKALGDDKFAYEAFERMESHLKDNGLRLTDTKYRLGRRLKFDPVKEQFVGDDQANAMLTRNDRPPFAVPEKLA